MRFICLIISTLLLWNMASFAYETKGELINLDSDKTLLEGEVINAQLRIWPLQDAIKSEVSNKLEGSEFLGLFYVSEVKKVAFSKNNSEVLEIALTLVVLKNFVKQPFYIWSYKALNIPIEIVDLKTVANTVKTQGVLVEESGYKYEFSDNLIKGIVSFITLVLVGLGVFFFSRFKKKKQIAEKVRKQNEKWHIKFREANDREDFEYIYVNRALWLKLLVVQAPPITQFFEVLNQHQYKKEWSVDDKVEISNCFDEIRNIFLKKA